MKITKKWIGALAIMALCATTALLFSACGGGDSDGSSSGAYVPPTDYNALFVGYWSGKGKNIDGESLSIYARFDSDKSGRVIMTTPNTFVGADIKRWYATENEIIVPSDKFSYPLTWRIISGSIQSGKIVIETQGYEGEFWGTVTLTHDEDSGGGGSSDVSTTPTPVTCYIVKYNNSTGKYSTSRGTYYKALSASGRVALYYSANGSMMGYASSNSDSYMGEYRVSSYSYVYRDVSTSSRTYYYFNE
ncbi:MAG: hypothetical protein IKP59_01230 [Prevotella sp.]|nr:hypothetical protein [Prevotella sp.]